MFGLDAEMVCMYGVSFSPAPHESRSQTDSAGLLTGKMYVHTRRSVETDCLASLGWQITTKVQAVPISASFLEDLFV
jgi:hypothetical protein